MNSRFRTKADISQTFTVDPGNKAINPDYKYKTKSPTSRNQKSGMMMGRKADRTNVIQMLTSQLASKTKKRENLMKVPSVS